MFRTTAAITCMAALGVGLWTAPVFANKANDTLRVAWDQQIDNADAYFNTNREGIILARMVWDQLIDRDPETFQYKPALATAWRWVDDLTLEFDLRQGVKRVGPKGDIKPGGHGVLTPGARLCVRPPAPWRDPQVGDTVACDR